MSDEVAQILAEMAGTLPSPGGDAPDDQRRQPDGAALIDEASFDERGYLRLNPDVATSVARGEFPSGYHHYMVHGFGEGRNVPGTPAEPRNRILRPAAAASVRPASVLPVIATPLIRESSTSRLDCSCEIKRLV